MPIDQWLFLLGLKVLGINNCAGLQKTLMVVLADTGVWLPWLLVEIFRSAVGNKTFLLICICVSAQDCDPVVFGSLSFPGKFTFLKGKHLTENELNSSSKSSQVVREIYGPRLSFCFPGFVKNAVGYFCLLF